MILTNMHQSSNIHTGWLSPCLNRTNRLRPKSFFSRHPDVLY